jgi:hypothetical protein
MITPSKMIVKYFLILNLKSELSAEIWTIIQNDASNLPDQKTHRILVAKGGGNTWQSKVEAGIGYKRGPSTSNGSDLFYLMVNFRKLTS